MSNTKPGTGQPTPLKEEADDVRTQRPEGQQKSGGTSPGQGTSSGRDTSPGKGTSSGQDTSPGQGTPPGQPVDDRPQHEDEYLSKFLQTPTPENQRKDGKEAEPVNKSPGSKPGGADQ